MVGRGEHSNRHGSIVPLGVHNDHRTVGKLLNGGRFGHQASRIGVESKQGCLELWWKGWRVVEAFVGIRRSNRKTAAFQLGGACFECGNRPIQILLFERAKPRSHEVSASVLIWKAGVDEHHSENLTR